MRILVDEVVPWPLHKLLAGHQCQSVPRCGWAGIKNGRALALAEPSFDLLLTADQSIAYQQKLAGRQFAIVQRSTNNLRRLEAAINLLLVEIAAVKPGEFRVVVIS